MEPEYIVALGMFDGVHRGHQALLRQAVEEAEKQGCQSMAFCFENHPATVFGKEVPLLSTPQQRKNWMLSLGIDRVEMIPFTKEFASLTSEAFLNYLMEQYPVKGLVAGFNYTFGRYGRGTEKTLVRLGKKQKLSVHIVEPVYYGDAPISSSRIREALLNGEAMKAREMLGRPYTLTGQVVSARGIGKSLGYPTANLQTEGMLWPKDGVYATAARVGGEVFAAVTNVGNNPTVAGQQRTVETHLLEVRADLYDRELEVAFLKRMRDEHRFPTLADLKFQIGRDALAATALYESFGKKSF